MSDAYDFGGLLAAPTQPGGGGDWMSNLSNWWKTSGVNNQFNDKGVMTGQGWGSPALGAAQGLFGAYMGMKQYGLAKDQFGEAKKQFGLNFDAQKRTTNAALADRQAARLSYSPIGTASIADYMSKYGIQGG